APSPPGTINTQLNTGFPVVQLHFVRVGYSGDTNFNSISSDASFRVVKATPIITQEGLPPDWTSPILVFATVSPNPVQAFRPSPTGTLTLGVTRAAVGLLPPTVKFFGTCTVPQPIVVSCQFSMDRPACPGTEVQGDFNYAGDDNYEPAKLTVT